jgi:hypothetical protein
MELKKLKILIILLLFLTGCGNFTETSYTSYTSYNNDPVIDQSINEYQILDKDISHAGMPHRDAMVDAMTQQCNDIQIGEACRISMDCCVNGSICIANENRGDDGICYRFCDDHADDTGCLATELCIPFNAQIDKTQPSPGFCNPDEQCAPGNENLACGNGTFSCLRTQNITTCLDLSQIPAESIKNVGERCDAEHFCQSGTVCEFGQCRAICNETVMCQQPNEQCVDYSNITNVDYAFCMDTCDLYLQDCEGNNACALMDVKVDEVIGQCVNGFSNGTAATSESCTPNDQTYWGSCKADHLCTQNIDSTNYSCVSICDENHLDQCGTNTACVTGIFNAKNWTYLGLCFGECDPFANTFDQSVGYTNPNCEAGKACNFVNIGPNLDTPTFAMGTCRDFPTDAVVEGANCIVTDETRGLSNCAPNMLCASLTQGSSPVCIKMCQVPNPNAGCSDGLICRTSVFEDLESIGLCLQ